MSNENQKDRNFVRIDLTPAQQVKVMESTGKEADAIELTANELEARIAPRMMYDP